MKIKRLLCGYGLVLVLAGQTSCTSTKQGDADTRQLAKLRAQAEQGRAKAQNELGEAFGLGKYGLATNSVEAVKWHHKAAEQNDAKAQYNLADCYYEGRGVPHDLVEAVKWYRKAAEQNAAKAQWAMGRCYALGHGVVKDEVEAVKWLRKAAAGGADSAFNDLAWILATSKNPTVRDGPSAVVFAEKAVGATSRQSPGVLDTLAAAYAEAGQFEKAVSTQQEAIALLKEGKLKDLCKSRLRLYEAKEPYRAKD